MFVGSMSDPPPTGHSPIRTGCREKFFIKIGLNFAELNDISYLCFGCGIPLSVHGAFRGRFCSPRHRWMPFWHCPSHVGSHRLCRGHRVAHFHSNYATDLEIACSNFTGTCRRKIKTGTAEKPPPSTLTFSQHYSSSRNSKL
jgi:hypothetical protein